MKYALIIDTVVKQVQPNKQKGFIGVDDSVVCGMIQKDGRFEKPQESLYNVKENKKEEIKLKFNEVSIEPVIVNGISYYGGYDSAQKLDGKRRLIVESGGTEVTYFDTDRNYHTHTLQEALDVCVTIAMKYETDLEHYSNKLKEIDSKLKVSTVESIVW